MNAIHTREGNMECHEMAVCALLGLRSRSSLLKPDNARLARDREEYRAAVDARENGDESGEMRPVIVRELPRLMLI